MVTFSCDLCADAVKKPKASQHMMRCRATMTCVDCGKVFNATTVNSHNSCVSEAEKYQGKLYVGPKHSEGGDGKACSTSTAVVDLSLIRGPPWMCKMCNVSCSGRDNLISHHQSKKHVNKAKHLASGSATPPSASNLVAARDAVHTGASLVSCSAENDTPDKKLAEVSKDAKCKIVKITNQLKACIRESIIKQHACQFYQVIGFHPEIEMYRYKGANNCVLRIKLTGEGSTYCPSKNTCFVRNCAEVWIHVDSQFRVWFRCDCGDCSNFHFGYDQMTFISKPDGMNKSYSDMFHNEMSIIHRSLRL